MAIFRNGTASRLLRVSADTLRRWADDGQIDAIIDASGHLAVEADEFGLEPEVGAVAVKSTIFSAKIPNIRPVRPFAPAGEARRAG